MDLQAECAKVYVQGLQYGPDKNHIEAIVSYMACSAHVYLYTSIHHLLQATCKHFDVHTGPENIPVSRFSFDAIVSYRDWIETHSNLPSKPVVLLVLCHTCVTTMQSTVSQPVPTVNYGETC